MFYENSFIAAGFALLKETVSGKAFTKLICL